MSAAVTSLRALEAVAIHQPLGVSELARLLQVPKPTAQRALQSLAEAQWIHRSETQPGRWALTAKALDVANHVGKELGVRETALPTMTELVELSTERGQHSPSDLANVPVERIVGVELNDANSPVVGTLFEDTVNRRRYCGDGDLDLPGPSARSTRRAGADHGGSRF